MARVISHPQDAATSGEGLCERHQLDVDESTDVDVITESVKINLAIFGGLCYKWILSPLNGTLHF
jgi:hypothetical protein